eukprot:scaffold36083_cov112-Isochrysis_galbana.AAC.3
MLLDGGPDAGGGLSIRCARKRSALHIYIPACTWHPDTSPHARAQKPPPRHRAARIPVTEASKRAQKTGAQHRARRRSTHAAGLTGFPLALPSLPGSDPGGSCHLGALVLHLLLLVVEGGLLLGHLGRNVLKLPRHVPRLVLLLAEGGGSQGHVDLRVKLLDGGHLALVLGRLGHLQRQAGALVLEVRDDHHVVVVLFLVLARRHALRHRWLRLAATPPPRSRWAGTPLRIHLPSGFGLRHLNRALLRANHAQRDQREHPCAAPSAA